MVNDLDHVVSKLDSYQGTGKMVLQTGQQPQKYDVEVWYQKPHYYRISLTNESKDVTQIVLRNDEGVFVLTPHLNKMFRFQSDWPENSGQVYLYQSLVQSIVTDTERQFNAEKDTYVFDVAANYQNGLLARQKIWLNKKSLAPQKVQVSDERNNIMVEVDFTAFEFGKKFEKDSFDMQRNMTSWDLSSLPTNASGGMSTNTKAGSPDTATKTTDAAKGATTGAMNGSSGTGTTGNTAGSTNGNAATSATGMTGTTGASGTTGTAGTTGSATGAKSGSTTTDASKTGANTPATSGSNNATNGSTGSSATNGTNGAATTGTGSNAVTGSNNAASGTNNAATGTTNSGTNNSATGTTNNTATGAKPGTTTPAANGATTSSTTGTTNNEALQQLLGIVEPEYTPEGVKKQEVKQVKLGEEQAILFRYSGKYNYTLIETQPRTKTVTSLPGDIVDLGYTLGVVTGDKNGLRTLTWTYDGMEYRLSTSDLPLQTEMIRIAQSVQGQVGK
ncbi:outer membrane lipoprotein carrier protein LolA [Paenibacillus koleovorans]|uniref:outer membrane lipoprotein carrier protein LolA n=1 Tax=Paenibacillus koleovorans TaxID=121608 RepID=UPI0027D864CF|nr:outer membrane lipoprotein carrier protein LolA [Paenibacillus koleovorans]